MDDHTGRITIIACRGVELSYFQVRSGQDGSATSTRMRHSL